MRGGDRAEPWVFIIIISVGRAGGDGGGRETGSTTNLCGCFEPVSTRRSLSHPPTCFCGRDRMIHQHRHRIRVRVRLHREVRSSGRRRKKKKKKKKKKKTKAMRGDESKVGASQRLRRPNQNNDRSVGTRAVHTREGPVAPKRGHVSSTGRRRSSPL